MRPAQIWVKPPGFAHPFYEIGKSTSGADLELTYASTARLSDSLEGNWLPLTSAPRIQHIAARPHLIVTNAGTDASGFEYCRDCGFVATKAMKFPDHSRADQTPQNRCRQGTPTRIVLGTDFITDVLTLRFSLTDHVILEPGATVTRVVMQTVCEAVSLAAARRFELEPTELAAGFRPALSEGGKAGTEVEIYLYDTLAGGAGYARACREHLDDILTNAIHILEGCSCDSSCYSCLRSFKNKLIHESLDRRLGAVLLRHVLYGEIPKPIRDREDGLIQQLAQQLQEQASEVTVEFNRPLEMGAAEPLLAPLVVKLGERPEFIVALTSALCSTSFSDERLKRSILLPLNRLALDELLVLRNLPAAIKVLQQ